MSSLNNSGAYHLINPIILKGINRYALLHEPKGSFVTAVLCNDLRETIERADPDNRLTLLQIVSYCHNEIPGMCWGSQQKVEAWLKVPQDKWLTVITAPETQKELDRQIEEEIWCWRNFQKEEDERKVNRQ